MSIETPAEKRRIAKANKPIMSAAVEALENDDHAEFSRLFRTLHVSADVALHIKKAYGAERIRQIGMRTDRAETVFGPDWLERDADELMARVEGDR